jgi:nicotinate-nucleotide adenylyltransferase
VADLAGHVDAFSSVPIDISATRIRQRLAAGEPVDWLVPAPVLAYIRARDLYRTTMHQPD